jgi:hypothetical protein
MRQPFQLVNRLLIPEELSGFSAGHTARRALYFGGRQSVARSGQESIAQGLPLVIYPTGVNPEGVVRCGGNRLQTFALLATSGH